MQEGDMQHKRKWFNIFFCNKKGDGCLQVIVLIVIAMIVIFIIKAARDAGKGHMEGTDMIKEGEIFHHSP
jgi:heme/copper-type cytochrome/quinol oxidase subunit 2